MFTRQVGNISLRFDGLQIHFLPNINTSLSLCLSTLTMHSQSRPTRDLTIDPPPRTLLSIPVLSNPVASTMLFSKVFSFALSVASCAIATPVAVSEDVHVDLEARRLAKRVEGVHLVNCGERYSAVIVRNPPLPLFLQSNEKSRAVKWKSERARKFVNIRYNSIVQTIATVTETPVPETSASPRMAACLIGRGAESSASLIRGRLSSGISLGVRRISQISQTLGEHLDA